MTEGGDVKRAILTEDSLRLLYFGDREKILNLDELDQISPSAFDAKSDTIFYHYQGGIYKWVI